MANKTNNNLLSRLEDLSIISKSGAKYAEITDAINQQSKHIQGFNKSDERSTQPGFSDQS